MQPVLTRVPCTGTCFATSSHPTRCREWGLTLSRSFPSVSPRTPRNFIRWRAPSMASMQSLPRFLLPQLSWKAPVRSPLAATAGAAFSSAASCQPSPPIPSRAFHPPRPASQDIARRSRPAFRSALLRQPELRRGFHASAPRQRDHHFDTLKFVQRLQSEGFTEEQSGAMMKVLNDVIEERYI